jgi:hypothetical protein
MLLLLCMPPREKRMRCSAASVGRPERLSALRGSAGAARFALAASMATFKDVGFEDLCFSKIDDSSPVLTLTSSHWFCLKSALTLLIRGRPLWSRDDAE